MVLNGSAKLLSKYKSDDTTFHYRLCVLVNSIHNLIIIISFIFRQFVRFYISKIFFALTSILSFVVKSQLINVKRNVMVKSRILKLNEKK